MVGVGSYHELPLPETQQVVFAQQTTNPLGVHRPALPAQLRRDPGSSIARPLQGDAMDGVTQFHVAVRPRWATLVEAVEPGPADPAQLHHALDVQSPVGLHFFLDLPVDRGFPVSACSIRCSSMRCKHPFKKSISRACWPTFRSNSAIRPSDQRGLPLPGKTLPAPSRNSRRHRCKTLGPTSSARAASAIDTPCSSRRTAASLNSLVNCLRDNPMTQFSIYWFQ